MANGWAKEDVFIDLHGIGAGERWRDALRKANTSCEAVLLLASPDSLDSKECLREINLAEDLGKEIIVAILRDLTIDDPRLAHWADRQFVDLSANPTEHMEPFQYNGQMQRVEFHGPALASIKTRLADLGIAPGSFTWTPKSKDAGPYPGLAAFSEDDAGIFFGREAEIMSCLTRLRQMRKRHVPRLLVIVAASGAGKSSFLRAGLWPRLRRDPDFAPLAILRPALGIMTGPDGAGRRIAPWFQRHGKRMVPGEINALLSKSGPEAEIVLATLFGEATRLAATVRRAGNAEARSPAPLIAIDQGEEMFAAENVAESQRFLELMASVLKEPPLIPSGRADGATGPERADPYVLVTIRADSVEALLQCWPALGLDTPEAHYLPPLSPTAYRDVIAKPAEVYSAKVRPLDVEPMLADRLVKDTSGADALPLLAFTLEKLFQEFGADGELTAERYESMGGIGGSIDRALGEAQRQAGAAGTAENLRRLIIPGLATWDPMSSAAKRLVAEEGSLVSGDRATLAPMSNALVANRLLTRGAGTLEVAHEALLRREPISGWLEAQKDALKQRDDVIREAKEWVDGGRHAEGLVRRGDRLQGAARLAVNADFATALAPAKEYLSASRKLEAAGRRRVRWAVGAGFALMSIAIAGLSFALYKDEIEAFRFRMLDERSYIAALMRPLAADAEAKLKSADVFKECVKDCPEMVVVPAGSFQMGSPNSERGRFTSEGPVHTVTIAKPFAVGKFTITWDEWEACVKMRGCRPTDDATFGKGRKPVINVTWDQAKSYAAWLSRITGKDYRLLTEAEWEYAARGVTSVDAPHVAYPWGDDEICRHANLADKSYKAAGYTSEAVACDDKWATTAHVGSFPSNGFGLHDMHGNVWQWVQDGWHDNYHGNPPSDGSVWTDDADTTRRVVRGGSWYYNPQFLRSASRSGDTTGIRGNSIGFRVGRTLTP